MLLPTAVAIFDLSGGVADPDTDDVRADAQPGSRCVNRTASPVPRKKMFDRIIAAYGRGLAKVLNHPWLTLSVALSTLLLSDAAVGVHSERFLPGTGQWHYSGHFAGTAIQLLCQYGPATTPVADVIFAGSGSAKPDLICWR
ncbi:hypothetical protein ACP0HM_09910 [Escherichia coli]